MKRAVFLDRDGVLNHLVLRGHRWVSPRTIADFRLVADAESSLARLRALGFARIVVTNQPDVSRHLIDTNELTAMHSVLGPHVDRIDVCPHDNNDECRCRKPKPGLIVDSAYELGIDLAQSWMVGDRWVDVEAGHRAGCRTILVEHEQSLDGAPAFTTQPDFRSNSLTDAVATIEYLIGRGSAE
jgi:D-glycero-D-manno-heptose 1,7-bisphosphate phosphatase